LKEKKKKTKKRIGTFDDKIESAVFLVLKRRKEERKRREKWSKVVWQKALYFP
jgi:hypothetical protein